MKELGRKINYFGLAIDTSYAIIKTFQGLQNVLETSWTFHHSAHFILLDKVK